MVTFHDVDQVSKPLGVVHNTFALLLLGSEDVQERSLDGHKWVLAVLVVLRDFLDCLDQFDCAVGSLDGGPVLPGLQLVLHACGALPPQDTEYFVHVDLVLLLPR